MTNGKLFWGIALVTLGSLFLLNRTGLLAGIDHEFVSRFWPVLFIIGGLALILRQREHPALRLTTILFAVAAPVIFFGLVSNGRNRDSSAFFSQNWNQDDEDSGNNSSDNEDKNDEADTDSDSDYQRDRAERDSASVSKSLTTNTFVEAMTPDTRTATLNLEGGAARFSIGAPVTDLIRANTRMTIGSYAMSVDRDETTRSPTVRLKPTEGKVELKNMKINNRVTLGLNAGPVWTMKIGMGAGTGDFDLTPYTVSDLTLEAGVADIDLKLGNKATQSTVKIDAGVASVVVRVPKSVGCRIINKGELNDEQFDDFAKESGGNTLISPGYAASQKKITITYDGGLSRFKVVRY